MSLRYTRPSQSVNIGPGATIFVMLFMLLATAGIAVAELLLIVWVFGALGGSIPVH